MEGLLAKMVKMDFSNVYRTSDGIKNLIKTPAIKAKGSLGLKHRRPRPISLALDRHSQVHPKSTKWEGFLC